MDTKTHDPCPMTFPPSPGAGIQNSSESLVCCFPENEKGKDKHCRRRLCGLTSWSDNLFSPCQMKTCQGKDPEMQKKSHLIPQCWLFRCLNFDLFAHTRTVRKYICFSFSNLTGLLEYFLVHSVNLVRLSV